MNIEAISNPHRNFMFRADVLPPILAPERVTQIWGASESGAVMGKPAARIRLFPARA